MAAEAENAEIVTISDFIELPVDIKEQSVPIGTALDELVLPDTLEAVCADKDTNAEENGQDESITEGEETVEIDTDTEINKDTETSAEPAADTVMQAETDSFVMPEYRTEHVIDVKTLEADSESEDNDTEKEKATDISGKSVTIENIIWQSECPLSRVKVREKIFGFYFYLC